MSGTAQGESISIHEHQITEFVFELPERNINNQRDKKQRSRQLVPVDRLTRSTCCHRNCFRLLSKSGFDLIVNLRTRMSGHDYGTKHQVIMDVLNGAKRDSGLFLSCCSSFSQ